MDNVIFAAYPWKSNADLILDCSRIGYIRRDDIVLDPTYGKGVWWKKFKPITLIRHDKYVLDGIDFRHLPEEDESVHVVAFDPPYVSPGGRETTTIPEFHDRFGMQTTPTDPAENVEMALAGIKEAHRVLMPRRRGRGGILIVKAQDYITSGKFFDGVYRVERYCKEELGLKQVDRMEMLTSGSRQPERTRKDGRPSKQQHFRRNISTMLVFEKKPTRRKPS